MQEIIQTLSNANCFLFIHFIFCADAPTLLPLLPYSSYSNIMVLVHFPILMGLNYETLLRHKPNYCHLIGIKLFHCLNNFTLAMV